MDREERKRFDWLPIEMPRVAALVKARRLKDGNEWVNECWRRGVINGEPGWFFAREGSLAVGVPAPWWSWPELESVPGAQAGAMVVMKDREVTHAEN